jgi:apolipoprotein N-acyltransferase
LVFITHKNHYTWAFVFVILVLFPALWQETQWSQVSSKPIPVGVIQANLSMRDKWDEELFWHLLQNYKTNLDALITKNKLIVMPESAIPLPENYVSDYLNEIHEQAKRIGSSVLFGIPQLTPFNDNRYYNTMMTLGHAQGSYLKQHLVPFGEFIPSPFQSLFERFALPMANMQPGKTHQDLIQIQNHPVATLICYELAYPELLRAQLPLAEWIVSISDDGWFGHSFAIYQHLQMAQASSLQMARYQIVANNDGLSSIINTQGALTASLPAFSPGLLEADIYPAQGSTPWVRWGDAPMQLLVLGLILCGLFLKPRFKGRKKSTA